jgi:signal peptidase I
MATAKQPETVRERAMSWVRSLVVAFALFLVIRTFLLGTFYIISGSMEGTLEVGDALFVTKALYGAEIPLTDRHLPGLRAPHRGDIVVFDSAEEPGLTVVKRLIGQPGDTIQMRNNFVFVNGDSLSEPYAVRGDDQADPFDPKMLWQRRYYVGGSPRTYRPTLHNWGPIVVPADSFLAMGDNRDESYDSRFWGFLGRDRIEGKAVLVYYSYDKDGVLPLPLITGIRWGRLFTILR